MTTMTLDRALNRMALPVFEALDADAIRAALVVSDDDEAPLEALADLEVDGTHDAFLVSDGRFETAVNVYWTSSDGDTRVRCEASGTATGHISCGVPVVERIEIGSLDG